MTGKRNTGCDGKPADGRTALIFAAERLISKYGTRGFTTRELTAAANMRNASAVHYHFGSREALIRAVAEHRFATINPKRVALLESVGDTDLRGIIEAVVLPLRDELQPRREGNHYVRFHEKIARDGQEAPFATVPPDLLSGWRQCEAMLRRYLATLPPLLIDLRITLAQYLMLSGLAAIETRLERSGDFENVPILVEALIDAVVAMLNCAPSQIEAD